MMRKSTHTREYAAFVDLLVEVRQAAGFTQLELAKHLGVLQPSISKMERGERRVDVAELKLVCDVLGLALTEFVAQYESRLAIRA